MYRKKYTVQFKINVVEDYINNNLTHKEICIKYSLKLNGSICSNLSKWLLIYKAGLLKIDNAISVAHRVPSKDKTIVINGKVWVEYIKPSEVININGIEYILGDR